MPTTTPSLADRHRGLHAELVRRPGLAFGDALDLRGVQRVQLVLGVPLLGVQALRRLEAGLEGAGHIASLALHVADHPTRPRA